jgi:malate/lactate dehydrogenase
VADIDKMSDDEIVALYEQIRGRAGEILAARHKAEFAAAREAGRLYVAHYMRYGAALTDESLTLDEAIDFLRYGEEACALSSKRITGPDGFVLEKDALSDLIWERDDATT